MWEPDSSEPKDRRVGSRETSLGSPVQQKEAGEVAVKGGAGYPADIVFLRRYEFEYIK